jgi:hypothetical protein
MAEPRSAMANPTKKINMLARNQPHTMPAGPAICKSKAVVAVAYWVYKPAGIE